MTELLKPAAKLISYSQPTQDITLSGDDKKILDDLIAFCARVSAPDNQDNYETGGRLINYLVKHKHWSPLEMVSACIEIGTTRDIARQILRHRSFSFQEYSQRYANPIEDLEFVYREARLQDENNRQNSIEFRDLSGDRPAGVKGGWEIQQEIVRACCESAYKWAIENGIAKEQARAVLPEGLTLSRLYMNGTLRSWVHFIDLRSGNGTQKEHMEIARACAAALKDVFPKIQDYVHEC